MAVQEINQTHAQSLVDIATKETNIQNFLGDEKYTTRDGFTITIESYPITHLPDTLLEWSFRLLEQNMAEFYKSSNKGWLPVEKRAEMCEPAARYLIAKMMPSPSSSSLTNNSTIASQEVADTCVSEIGDPVGFLLFQFSWEEDGDAEEVSSQDSDENEDTIEIEVIYCYEIQLSPQSRGKGIGTFLMKKMEEIGRRWGMKKSILTTFKANTKAMDFYCKHLGYKIDTISPSIWLDDSHEAAKYDYEILSKVLCN